MDILIAFILLVIAVALIFKRPIPIHITVTHKIEQDKEVLVNEEQEKTKEEMQGVADITKVLQDIMLGDDRDGR